MILALLLAQDLDPEYVKQVAAIQKEHARQLFDLTVAQAKAKRSPMLKVDLKRVMELDPAHEAARKLWDKVKDLSDETRVIDKTYAARRKKVREEIAKAYDALAAKTTGRESEDARKLAEGVRAEPDAPPPGVDEVMLKQVNEIRASCGLPAVELDDALSKGCAQHAAYLVANADHPKVSGLGAHEEDPSLPGATPEGARAGKASDISYAPPQSAVNDWNETLYHRIPMLQPTLKRIGAGYAAGGRSGHVCLLDVMSGNTGPKDPKFAVVAYPPDGAAGVGTEFGGEIPNPVPDGARGGYPITLTFFDRQKVTEVVATLHEGPPPKTKKDKLGAEVACFVSTPEKPATTWTQWNTVCLIPKAPLAKGATYTVKVTAKANTAAFEKVWSFGTR